MGVFSPSGFIATQEGQLMIHAIELMLIVVIPVYILTFFFAWHYRASNKKSKAVYMPNWQHAKMDELIWWAIPFEIVLILGALTWTSTHQLDPRQPIVSDNQAITVEVVALPWKWLFIYPDSGVATVNFVELPVNTPVKFQITADAPMNSFWIPQLGGQIYAMTGMVSELNLIADHVGTYQGMSANYSGDGFAEMKFKATAVSAEEFAAWISTAKHSNNILNQLSYTSLAAPSEADTLTYSSVDGSLYNSIVTKFMNPDMPHMHDE